MEQPTAATASESNATSLNEQNSMQFVLIRGLVFFDEKLSPDTLREFRGKIMRELMGWGSCELVFASWKKGVHLLKFDKQEFAQVMAEALAAPEARAKFLGRLQAILAASSCLLPKEFTIQRGPALLKAENQDGLDLATEQVKSQWKQEQERLKSRLITTDNLSCGGIANVRLLGGLDISFVKDSATDACASLIVLDASTLKVVYQDFRMVKLTRPYIPGFLAFREVDHLLDLIQRIRSNSPELVPDVCFIDGNGVLHPRGLGLASHAGILCNMPMIGVAKTLMFVDGLSMDTVKPAFVAKCTQAGHYMDLVGDSGRIWGVAWRSSNDSSNPIFVSVGHRVSLAAALQLVACCSVYRVPEPIRQADLRSRAFLREGKVPAVDANLQPPPSKQQKPITLLHQT